MDKVIELRNQEYICRERALLDREHRPFWLAKAEEWEQRALDEIAFHFRECNIASPPALVPARQRLSEKDLRVSSRRTPDPSPPAFMVAEGIRPVPKRDHTT